MQFYPHEQRTERDQAATNTVWPLMSTNGVDVDDCKAYLKERGLSWELAEENGWYPSRNAMDNFLRIVIPAVSTQAGHVYWQARAVSQNIYIRYQTPRGPRHGALIVVNFDAQREYETRRNTKSVVIVEGPMDALAVAACGYDAIALMGMAPGALALSHLVKLVEKRPALIVLDNEPAAQAAAHSIAMCLASAGGKAHVEKLSYAKDLAAVASKVRRVWLRKRLEEL